MGLQEELDLPRPIEYPGHEALLSIILTGQLFAKEGDRLLKPLGLTDSQLNVLVLLKNHDSEVGVSQTQLGRMLLVNRSNVTGLIDRMERAGLVERTAARGDRRTKLIRLTTHGRKQTERAEKAYFKRIDEVMGDLSPKDMKTLCRILEGMRAKLS